MKRRVCLLVFVALASQTPRARAQQTPLPGAPGAALSTALEAAHASNYETAEKALLTVGGVDRQSALLALGRVMHEQGRFAEADRYASQAASFGGAQRFVALALRGEVLAAQGKVDDAIRLLEPGKDATGVGGRRARLVLGELLIRAGRRGDAEPILLKFADEYGSDQISSRDPEGLAMVGRAMHLLRHVKDANRAYN